jgi:hypothetical protein
VRRSSTIRLTLLPMLAAAACAPIAVLPEVAIEPRHDFPPPRTFGPPGATLPIDGAIRPEEMPPLYPTLMDDVVAGQVAPPAESAEQLPCEQDPRWELRPDCLAIAADETDEGDDSSGIIRGGFGGYFYSSGS